MKIKAKYEKFEDIPEAVREMYEERDGAWHLKKDAVEGVKTQADVDRVQGALKKEREAKEKAEVALKKFESLGDRDVEELLKASDEVEDLKAQLEQSGKGKASNDETAKKLRELERQNRDLTRERDKLKGDHATEKARADNLDGSIKTSKIEAEITRIGTAQKVRSEAIPDMHMYRGIFEVADDGSIRAKDNVGVTPGITVEEWLGERRKTSPHWWPTSEGGGAQGGDGKNANGNNPFAKGAFNFTEANRIAKADPGKALNLARQAGFASVEAAVIAGATPAPPK